MKELPKVYEPQQVEGRIYQMWMDHDCFKATPDPDKKPFSIVMPPPNVTGQLHMGHAMDATLQDILTRFKRMQGYEALWLPGTDHAGIATQIKVEGKVSDIDKMKVEEQKKAARSGYDMDILPPDLVTYSNDAKTLLEDLQSRNERMFLLTFLVVNMAPTLC